MEEQDDYIKFVEKTVAKYQRATKLGDSGEITPPEINRILGEYHYTHLGLIAEYQRAKQNHRKQKNAFNSWWDSKVQECRLELLKEIKGTKWPAYKEYELAAGEKYKEEYDKRLDELGEYDMKEQFLRRLVESWKSFDNILVNLSQNMRSELRALSLDNRANYESKKRQALT